MNLKPRSAQAIVEHIKSKGFEVSDEGGFLSVTQGAEKTQMNVASILQACFKQVPEQFYGHSGEVRYKSDVLDNQAKVQYINDHGYAAWAALPVNENSPSARNVIKPTIVSTELTRNEWLTLTPAEKSEAISGWGKDGLANVSAICARTK
jgi:hypothetical protein